MSRIFVVGCDGYIGMRMCDYLDRPEVIRVYGGENVPEKAYKLDLLKCEAFDFDIIRKDDRVVMLAAVSSPDLCEKEFDLCHQINVIGTAKFIEGCLKRGARLIFFSSDAVYGQQENPSRESETTHPTEAYGMMKAAVENIFKGYKSFVSFRLSYVLSAGDRFTLYLKKCAQQGTTADVFHPYFRNMVDIGDVLESVRCVTESDWSQLHPIYNIAGSECVSRAAYAEASKKLRWPNLDIHVINPGEHFYKSRASIISVDNTRIKELLGRNPINIEESISRQNKEES
jgi:dTDP-4-dehydrorhamnose reductase